LRRLVLTSLAALLALATASGSASGAPRVTVISDSVLTSVTWYSANMAILEEGVDLDLHVAICRRLAVTSCAFEGVPPPTLFDVLPTITSLSPTVVVEMGYNDDPTRFRGDVRETLGRLTARGATRIVWPTLFASTPAFTDMNGVLLEAMAANPQLALVDWDGYARRHYDWFQTDNLHLTPAGGAGIATLLHKALVEPLVLPRLRTAPVAHVGVRYQARLTGPQGTTGTWQLLSGALPRGLHVSSDGLVSGVPLKIGSTRAGLVFRSADFQLAYQEVGMRVAAAPRPATVKRRKQAVQAGAAQKR
jgi:hypothetical protein